VLQTADLPAGFALEHASAVPTTAGEKAYDAVYTKRGVLEGLVRVESKAAVFATAADARLALALAARGDPYGNFRRVAVRWRLGDDSLFYVETRTGTSSGERLSVYLVLWRSGPVFAALYGGGISRTLRPADVVALARKQQARITRSAH
jgi:hypothetical protein